MSLTHRSPLIRVRKGSPCPICAGLKWCSVSEDGAVALCSRIAEGSYKTTANGAWIHFLQPADNSTRLRAKSVSITTRPATRHDLYNFARQCETAIVPQRLESFAIAMGLTVDSMKRLGIGWAGFNDLVRVGTPARSSCWTFPMRNSAGDVLGIRLRAPDGFKFSATGGTEGLFIPAGLSTGSTLIIAEGPTDTAALLDMGANAVGRPSCKGGVRLLVDLVRRYSPSRVVIAADLDAVGQEGATTLANALSAYVTDLRAILPPEGVKDVRAWRMAGATAADLDALIDAAETWHVEVDIAV